MPRFLSLGQLTETMWMLRLEWAHWAKDNCALKTEVREKIKSFLLTGRPGGPENPGIPVTP